MRPLDGAVPFYLDVAGESVFALVHEPETRTGLGVLVCPPWGWEDIASYRSRAAWALALARDGHTALRFDLPGSGDSSGSPGDPGRIAAWVASIAEGARWLREERGCTRIAALGLGLSGLLAAAALADGAQIDDLVLWAAPVRGRAFARGERAFSQMQAPRYSITGEAEPTGLPEGWLESGGFVLSADTLAAVQPLDLRSAAPSHLRRALLLDRDGIAPDPAIIDHLRAAGVEVETAAGKEWSDFVSHPERTRPPTGAIAAVGEWLRRAGPEPAAPAPSAPGPARLAVDGGATERPELLTLSTGGVFAIVAEPAERRTGLCVVFLNAGAVRRVGPNRIWTEAARRWAARGVVTVRADLEAIGDGEGDEQRFSDVGEFYVPSYAAQVRELVGELGRRGLGERFALVGLCAGAYWAFETAGSAGIVSAIMLNPGALVWDPDLVMRREAHKIRRLRDPVWRARLRGGDLAPRAIREVAVSGARLVLRSATSGFSTARQDRALDDRTRRRLDDHRGDGARLAIVFSQDEPIENELTRAGVFEDLDRWPSLVIHRLPGRDHTLRPVPTQRAAHDVIDREIELVIGG